MPFEASDTVTLTEPLLSFGRSPTFQVTVPAEKVPPPVADTKVVPGGSGSVIVTLSAGP